MSVDLTPAQLAVWFAQQQVADAPVYQCAERVEIDGPFDAERFADVVSRCLAQVPALNARYTDDGDGPRRIPEPRRHPVVVHDAGEQLDAVVDAAMGCPPISNTIAGEQLSAQHLVRIGDDRHVWITRIHHVAVDGYSFARLLRWIADSYTADAAGDPLPESPFATPDPAAPDPTADAPTPEDAEFWAGYLDSARPPSVSRAEPSPATARARRTTVRLAPRTANTDRGWAESLMATLACYTATLTGETSVTLGVPWANRRLGAPPTMEPEVNILPLRVEATPTMTVGELIGAVATELRTVRPHTGYRADRLRRDLGLVGADTPLFGPSANLKFFTPQLTFGDATGTVGNIAMGPVDDLTVTGSPAPDGGFVLEVETNPARYGVDESHAHADRLAALLSRISADDAAVTLGSLPIATAQEARHEVVELNRTDDPALRETASTTTLTALLAAAGDRFADRTALVWGENALTYAGLRATVSSLAAELRRRGVGRGDVVALRLVRSPETVAGLLAALDCGAAYLPIDPELPAERIDGMLEDTRARVLLTAPDGDDPDWTHDGLALRIESLPSTDSPNVPDSSTGDEPPTPEDGAYIIFTSGSTGRPKGVLVEHRSIVNRLLWMDREFTLTGDDRVVQKTPYSFDVSVWEFFWPLITGATLVLATPGLERDSAGLAREFVAQGITVCHFVPSALAAFLAAGPADAGPNPLRLVVCSGEALPPDVLRRGLDTLPGTRIANLYGPTEAAVDVTEWTPGPDWDGTEVPIGSPIANTRTYVLDSARRPQVPGAVGELYLAGIQLARGYVGRPELTAQKFVPDPFVAGERMYATGDLVHRDDAGLLIYDGRVDDQVKVRGRRIELGEIQAALADLDGVDQAAVITREVVTGTGPSTLIVGYVVPAVGVEVDSTDLRDRLSRRLPSYMVPDAVEVLAALPMTRNGKLDRRALPEPQLGSDDVVAPRSPREAALEPLFAAALGRDHVSVTDSFFDLGGTSLTASVLARRCSEALGEPFGVADLFGAPSVAALAARLDGGESGDAFGRLLTLRPAPDGGDPGDRVAPVFAIHPAGGLGWCYAGLLPVLDPRIGLYALQADGLDGGPLPESITEVARSYLDTIDSVAPDGPIRLLGWSVGGVIAHEIAVLASERGREVSQVVLLDAYPSECWADQPPATPAEVRRALLIMAGADSSDDDLRSDDDVLAALRENHAALGGLTTEQVRRITDVVAHFATLMRAHRTGVIGADARHYAAAESAEDFLSPRAWEPHIEGSVAYTELPVNHPGMVSPETLATVAAALADPAVDRCTGDGPEALRSRIVDTEPGADADEVMDALRRHGTPLITDHPDDPASQRVLLTHTAPDDAAGVYAWVNRITDAPDGPDGELRRWGSTPLWFTEFAVPRGTLATYRFYPYRADDPALVDGRLRYSRPVADAAVSDPTNPDAQSSPFGSVLVTDGAPDLDGWRVGDDRPAPLAEGVLPGPGDPIRWRLIAPSGGDRQQPTRLVVVPDADKWFDVCDLPGVLARAGSGAPIALLGIDSPAGGPARLQQLGANRDFVRAVADTVAHARARLEGPTTVVWTGQSLGGLTALAAAAWHPDAVDELIVYSPSLWWKPGLTGRPADVGGDRSWIAGELESAPPRPLRLAVGLNERLLVDPVGALARELSDAGWPVSLTTYPGGHDLPWWADLLLTELTAPTDHHPES
ncbi:MAG: amino acid adenylation domain-containing protein [Gordonia sp. (in: high G+C Gram-positive bacteria)]|uniref:amino acid adenylation domain-containing protein n=1 Tax=Gordonia sp. (in: high G+C Gram-positive bacteria) TaxID=84139 RepID=UPI0039E3FBD5